MKDVPADKHATALQPYYFDSTQSELNRWSSAEQTERAGNLAYYGNKPRLDVTVSNEYTHWTAWAHTEPERHVISIRPAESIDYRLTVLPHEIVHNYAPGLRNEDHVTQIGQGPLFYHIERAFRYSYH